MDPTAFFCYPGEPPAAPATEALAGRSEEDWALLLAHTETRRFRPGDEVLAAGASDRALYVLVDGRLAAPGGHVEPVATIGEGAFLDGRPRAVSVTALTHGELLRLSFDAFSALAAHRPRLGRELLLDLARVQVLRLRGLDDVPNWTG